MHVRYRPQYLDKIGICGATNSERNARKKNKNSSHTHGLHTQKQNATKTRMYSDLKNNHVYMGGLDAKHNYIENEECVENTLTQVHTGMGQQKI